MRETPHNGRERCQELEQNIRQGIRRLNEEFRTANKVQVGLVDEIAEWYAERCIILRQEWAAYELMSGLPKRQQESHSAFFKDLKLENEELLELVLIRVIDLLEGTIAEVDLTKIGSPSVDSLREDFAHRMEQFADK